MFQWVECLIDKWQGDEVEIKLNSLYNGSAHYRVSPKHIALVMDESGATRTVLACRRPRHIDRLIAVQVPGKRCNRSGEQDRPVILPLTEAIFKPNGTQTFTPLSA